MSNRVIIAIHGLGQKPPHPPYGDNWRDAMLDGLRRNLAFKGELPDFRFVYWGLWKWIETRPAERYEAGPGTGRYPDYIERWQDELLAKALDAGGDFFDVAKRYFGLDAAADEVLRRALPDLATYYDEDAKRLELRALLHEALSLAAGKRIMLVAHSMGTIVAYDVLRELGERKPDFTVEHFVTLGSPLGLPHVLLKIVEEWRRARVPTVVRRWTNLAERRDPIALDVYLRGDFAANDRGVTIDDHLVINSYPGRPGPWAHHAAYGYLRTPEFSRLVHDFI